MLSVSVMEMLKQQYTSCMKIGTGRNLDLSREHHKKLFGALFYSWWNCPLIMLLARNTKANDRVNSTTNLKGPDHDYMSKLQVMRYCHSLCEQLH